MKGMTWFKPSDIRHVANTLKEGAVCLFPFDTIWGLTCILAPEPVARIQALKQRDDSNPMLIMMQSISELQPFVTPIQSFQRDIMNQVWPGPTTLILPKTDLVPDFVTGGLPTVGVRVPMYWPVNCLLHEVGQPIVSTSANLTQTSDPMSFDDVSHDIRSRVDFSYVGVEAGGRQASEIWDCTQNPPTQKR